jgi:heme/copper-type cytochrome/quinol oxidase subunit 2
MVFALLAKFLLTQALWVQAVVLGLCTGLFVTALAEADERDPVISTTVRLVLIWGGVAATLYYAGFLVQSRRGEAADHLAPRWLYAVYAVVWVFGVLAALLALLGEGGFSVAVLAIVPLVLLAPTALYGIRMILHRAPA